MISGDYLSNYNLEQNTFEISLNIKDIYKEFYHKC